MTSKGLWTRWPRAAHFSAQPQEVALPHGGGPASGMCLAGLPGGWVSGCHRTNGRRSWERKVVVEEFAFLLFLLLEGKEVCGGDREWKRWERTGEFKES